MIFAAPIALFALVFVFAMAGVYVWTQTRRRRYPLSYSSISLVRGAVGPGQTLRRHLPAALYLLALTALVLALARPHATIVMPQATGTIILTIDASGSMATADVKPTRIEAAKAAVRDFVAKEPKGVRIGVVAFSAGALLLTPPTENREQVLAAVNFLALGRGTNIGDGLQVSLDTILYPDDNEATVARVPRNPNAPKPVLANPDVYTIILLSDGASTTGPNPLDIARQIADAGVRTYTVGIGTVSGAPFSGGGGRFMELDEPTLKGIAEVTDGKYYTAQNTKELQQVYGKIAKHYELISQTTEVTFLVAAAGLVLLLAGGVLGMLWSNKLP